MIFFLERFPFVYFSLLILLNFTMAAQAIVKEKKRKRSSKDKKGKKEGRREDKRSGSICFFY